MAETNSSAPLKTAEGAYPALPASVADVVCWGDGKPLDIDWGAGARLAGGTRLYTAEQMRAYAAQAVADRSATTALNGTAGNSGAPDQPPVEFAHAYADQLMLRCLVPIEPAPQAVAAQAAPAVVAVLNDDLQDLVSKALRKAWQLGKIYRQQADSEYISQQNKSDATQAKFQELIDETRAALAATPALPAAEDSSAGDLAEVPDDFGSAEHWKEKAQYWAEVAHELRGQALRGEPVDGIIQPPAQAEVQAEPVAQLIGVDEYGPRLNWFKHWVDLPKKALLYTAPHAAALNAETPYQRDADAQGAPR